eukprot:716577-Hanusia_phi.AAC.1
MVRNAGASIALLLLLCPSCSSFRSPVLVHETLVAGVTRRLHRSPVMMAKIPQNLPLKDERGNNIGDTRYTTNYAEDLRPENRERQEDSGTALLHYAGTPSRVDLTDSHQVAYGRQLIRLAEIVHCTRGHDFKVSGTRQDRCGRFINLTQDEELFYRFVSDYEKG